MADSDQQSASPTVGVAWKPGSSGSFVIKNTFLYFTAEEENENLNRMVSTRFCRGLRPKSEPPRDRADGTVPNRQAIWPLSPDSAMRWADESDLALADDTFIPQVTAPTCMTRWPENRYTSTNDDGNSKQDEFATCADSQETEPTAPRRSRFNEQRRICQDPMPWNAGVVTVMIRQVPRRYSQQQFLEKVVEWGFEGLVTFVYLPVAMKKFVNVGYGFVSFTEPQHALRFRDMFDDGFLDTPAQSDDKPLRIHPATVQGYQAACLYFSWKPKDMRCGPIFLGPNGQGSVDVVGQQAELADAAQQSQQPQQRLHTVDEEPARPSSNRKGAWGSETSKTKGGNSPPGSWIQGKHQSAESAKPSSEKPRGRQGGRGGPVFLGLNQPRQSRGWRGDATLVHTEGSPGAGKPSPRATEASRNGQQRGPLQFPPRGRGTPHGGSHGWRGGATAQPAVHPVGKLDSWGGQTGSRALGA
mmetsp:Transcript_63391/g.163095  ORF Transcript_63391/g.163095 Transcript_63391/m.163095 type:complete len:471 (+) Transcript_63391:41-1453(+)|eukprot:CAMPEP_0195101378 /NCGR_PEP_ID=MMETSP0448-20130528/65074_1 /TAXON_ID=66468 /ORGANISM="Heterocapsa triquestra, Strain CCMP 448" /LENGTH=470 /DNA_ID=CAMNT_0040136675 /DNA_START=41 /DNA_END=1453 /DNA_ORIENTATION=+